MVVERAILMCGGKGRRMRLPFRGVNEKPLVKVCGIRLVEHALNALMDLRAMGLMDLKITALYSMYTSGTGEFLKNFKKFLRRERVCEVEFEVIRTPGMGYVEDLMWYLQRYRVVFPVLVVSTDLVFARNVLPDVLEYYAGCETPALSCVSESGYMGINVVDGYFSVFCGGLQKESVMRVEGVFNVNTREDVYAVEKLLGEI